jgi:hypothetical protein
MYSALQVLKVRCGEEAHRNTRDEATRRKESNRLPTQVSLLEMAQVFERRAGLRLVTVDRGSTRSVLQRRNYTEWRLRSAFDDRRRG